MYVAFMIYMIFDKPVKHLGPFFRIWRSDENKTQQISPQIPKTWSDLKNLGDSSLTLQKMCKVFWEDFVHFLFCTRFNLQAICINSHVPHTRVRQLPAVCSTSKRVNGFLYRACRKRTCH